MPKCRRTSSFPEKWLQSVENGLFALIGIVFALGMQMYSHTAHHVRHLNPRPPPVPHVMGLQSTCVRTCGCEDCGALLCDYVLAWCWPATHVMFLLTLTVESVVDCFVLLVQLYMCMCIARGCPCLQGFPDPYPPFYTSPFYTPYKNDPRSHTHVKPPTHALPTLSTPICSGGV